MKSIRTPRSIRVKYEHKAALIEADSIVNPAQDMLGTDLAKNEQFFRETFNNCSDIVYRILVLEEQSNMLLIYVDGLLDVKQLNEILLKPLLFEGLPRNLGVMDGLGKLLQSQSIPIGETKIVSRIQDVVQSILKGNVAIFVAGEDKALIASMKGWSKRSIEEPSTEQVIRGPREGFIETLRENTSLIRRKIHSPKLKTESLTIGNVSQTDVVIVYIEGIAMDAVLNEVRQRLNRIQIDGVFESGYLEEFLEDSPFSIFPTVQNTERPEVVAANLLEGKVAILTDGTPFALVVPMTFWGSLQANEDYFERFIISTATRWIRFIFAVIALILPSLYVALVTFQQEMLPTSFLLTIAAAQEATPFPAVVEAFVMEFMFEGLREAGVRLPKAVGSAISIVGALVIGQAAVQAGIVSAPMVIIVAMTGIASFIIPRYNLGTAIRLLRFPLLFLAGVFGFFGIAFGMIAILMLLVSMRSFGVPYFSPLAPLAMSSFRDILIRSPWWGQTRHLQTAQPDTANRIAPKQIPHP